MEIEPGVVDFGHRTPGDLEHSGPGQDPEREEIDRCGLEAFSGAGDLAAEFGAEVDHARRGPEAVGSNRTVTSTDSPPRSANGPPPDTME